jgi:hypothetical protein
MLPLAAIPLIASGLQAGVGAIQAASGAKKRRGTVRPTYGIPDEIRKNLAIAENEASYGLSGESKRLATEGTDRATAAALYGAGTRRSGLSGLGGVMMAGSDAAKNLAEIDQIARERKQANAMATRETMAGYKDKAFGVNQMEPYQLKVDESQALIGAGMQNVGGALNTLASTGMYGMAAGEGRVKNTADEYKVDASGLNPYLSNIFGRKKKLPFMGEEITSTDYSINK